MRLRFSLRTLFILTTVVAGLCVWFMLPSIMARRFLATIAKEEYKSADEFFQNANDRFLGNTAQDRGGAIALWQGAGGEVQVVESTISGNDGSDRPNHSSLYAAPEMEWALFCDNRK